MKTKSFLKKTMRVLGALMVVLLLVASFNSCKGKKGESKSQPSNEIEKVAKEYQKQCPKALPNNMTLQSVIYEKDTLRFRVTLSDDEIARVKVNNVRDSLIANMTDNLRNALIDNNCTLEYKYMSPHDSAWISIVPKDLKQKKD